MLLSSCASFGPKIGSDVQSPAYLLAKFNKICLAGTGKGRIELVSSKYTFSYESQINRVKNMFELALDFPIIGETSVSLSLNPKEVSRQIGRSNLVEILKERVGERVDRDQIIKTMEEFFVFASDFIHYKSSGIYPAHFKSTSENNHFILRRETPRYIFKVDNFSESENLFERTVFKIFLKSTSINNPIMTLFLVPQSCDK